jgi:hypothetical protein
MARRGVSSFSKDTLVDPNPASSFKLSNASRWSRNEAPGAVNAAKQAVSTSWVTAQPNFCTVTQTGWSVVIAAVGMIANSSGRIG